MVIEINKELLKDSINKKTIKKFLQRLNKQEASSRKNNLTITINDKNYEELFYPEYPGKEEVLFEKLLELERVGIVSIQYGVKRTSEALWNRKTKIVFNLESEGLCREVLNMPSTTPLSTWSDLIETSTLNRLLKDIFSTREIVVYGRQQEEIIDNIEKRLPLIKQGMTSRQISAILFWGLSKVLDNRIDIVNTLGGSSLGVMLNVCGGSSDFSEVVFIENYDTYVDYVTNRKLDNFLIVYSAGFSTSTMRIRSKNGCSLHYSNQDKLTVDNRKKFESWLYKESPKKIKISFFGDFDFSGVSIFNSLRNLFPEITMYKNGYDPMLKEVKNGNGHLPEMASKENQIDPKVINDRYCDDILLPVMREYGFYDQEGIIL